MAEDTPARPIEKRESSVGFLKAASAKAEEIEQYLTGLQEQAKGVPSGIVVKNIPQEGLRELTTLNTELKHLLVKTTTADFGEEYGALNREMSHDIYAVSQIYLLAADQIGLVDIARNRKIHIKQGEARAYGFVLDPVMMKATRMIIDSIVEQVHPEEAKLEDFDAWEQLMDVANAFDIRHRAGSRFETKSRVYFGDATKARKDIKWSTFNGIEGPVMIRGNKNHFLRVWANTIGNSLKSVNKVRCIEGQVGEIVIEARNSVNADDNRVIIEIRDNGKILDVESVLNKALENGRISQKEIDGMDEKSRKKRAYELIYGGDLSDFANKGYGGTGTGLTIVKHFIEEAGGSFISTDNPETEGFRTDFILPLAV